MQLFIEQSIYDNVKCMSLGTLSRTSLYLPTHLLAKARKMVASNYENWTKEDLIRRITHLEKSASGPNWLSNDNNNGAFRFSAYSTRKIALKFCYSGWEYNGLAYQNKPTPLPTVEGVLFSALAKARLIDEEKGFEGCGWEKCGRTDSGVSAAGQVISLYVRTALVEKQDEPAAPIELPTEEEDDMVGLFDGASNTSLTASKSVQEHDYTGVLNRLLPPTIRVLAWSPVEPDFSARYSCAYRHYKYFFSSLNLDISLMRQAASYLVGLHDFRNLCKIDAQKQLTAFNRRILTADIVEVEGEKGIYVLHLIGSAFLYHQVRCIMAILLMVGRDLESPDIVLQLLNVTEGAEPGEFDALDQKPEYQMADALPLVLWECGYNDGDVTWHTGPVEGEVQRGQGRGVHQHLQEIHERSRIFTVLNKHFLLKAEEMGHMSRDVGLRRDKPLGVRWSADNGVDILYGGGATRRVAQYVPLMLRRRNDNVETINERWRTGKGKRREGRKNGEAEDEDDDDGGGDE